MRKLIVIGIGLGAGIVLAAVMLATGEEAWLSIVGAGTCLLIGFMVSWWTPGGAPVTSAMVRWNGGDRRALIVPMSRSTFATAYVVLGAAAALFIFVGVMALVPDATRPSVQTPLLVGLAGAVLVLAVVPVAAPYHLALLREGVLVRAGPVRRFVPWATVATVERRDTQGEYPIDFLMIRAHAGNRTRADWLFRPGRGHGLSIPFLFFEVDDDEVLATVLRVWRDPGRAERFGTPAGGQAPVVPHETVRETLQMVADGSVEFAILTADRRRNYYVQLYGRPPGQVDAEAVSNAYLDPKWSLDEQRIARLIDIGWAAPAGSAANFSTTLTVGSDDELDRASDFILQTLRDVYGLAATRAPRIEVG